MTRKTTSILLDSEQLATATPQTIEKSLRDVPGALRVRVNTSMETAYVEYDADRCDEGALRKAVESADARTVQAPMLDHSSDDLQASPFSLVRLPMRDTPAPSRTWWAFAGFMAIAAFFLLTEHRAHLFGFLPFIFLLACPFLHMFGHGGHGSHGNHGGYSSDSQRMDSRYHEEEDTRGELSRPVGHHHHPQRAARDDWRN